MNHSLDGAELHFHFLYGWLVAVNFTYDGRILRQQLTRHVLWRSEV